MRLFFAVFFATIGLAASLCLPVALTGCKNSEQTAYRTVSSVAITVDGAMKAWADYVNAGHAKTGDEDKVRAAYLKYQASMLTAQKLATAARNAPEGEAAYVTAINMASQASLELIALIQQFTQPK